MNRVVKQRLGTRKASFASPDETRALTGMAIGGVTAFGLPDGLPLWIDGAVMERPRIVLGGGSRSWKVIAPPSIHILLMFACTPADDWMRSPGTVNAGQSWSYNIPARPGDVIRLEARALDKFIKRERLFVVHDNVFFNQHGEVICSGRGWTIRPM